MALNKSIPVLVQNVSREKIRELVIAYARTELGAIGKIDSRFPIIVVDDKYNGFDVHVVQATSQ